MTADRDLSEMLSLQAQLAYSAARGDIECHCGFVSDRRHNRQWYDLSSVEADDRETVADAIRYLDLRGLIERHENGVWVRVREEDA
ncbi:MAG: hypothetical protein LT106_18715 [Burkholderiaceae bacterium]|nr:hypothetical protein [Burkholderiaceae bacterium]